MKAKTTTHFYRWRHAAPFKLSYLIPEVSFTKNVQGPSFNRSYSIKWINWEFTIWHTIYDFWNGIEDRMILHELNVQKYIN